MHETNLAKNRRNTELLLLLFAAYLIITGLNELWAVVAFQGKYFLG